MLSYENVQYDRGPIIDNTDSAAFRENRHYDTTKSSRQELVQPSRSNVGNGFISANPRLKPSNLKPPSTGQLTKSLAALGSTLRGIKIAREFQDNPKQAWTVYGFNIKDVLANSLANAIFASAAQVTTVSDTLQQDFGKEVNPYWSAESNYSQVNTNTP